jgi:predicted ABC-class ATPase
MSPTSLTDMNDKSFAVRRDVKTVLNNASFGRFHVKDMEVSKDVDGNTHVSAEVVKRNSPSNEDFMPHRSMVMMMEEQEVIGMKDGKVRFRFY